MIIDFLVALVLAVVLAALLTPRWRGSSGAGAAAAAFFLILILFPAIWAMGLWMRPVGPAYHGAHVLSYVLGGLFIFLLLLAAAAPSRPRPSDHGGDEVIPAEAEREATRTTVAVFGIFFWLLVVAAMLAIAAAYW
ncbi:MAG: hypothetical protein ACOCXJ_05750 [Planctomycetota bacterium]